MPVLIASSVALTCLGDDLATYEAVLGGRCGVSALRGHPAAALNVRNGYQLPEGWPRDLGGWLGGCVAEAVRRAGLDPARERVPVLVGTGLRRLAAVERWAGGGPPPAAEDLHFAADVRRAVPGLDVAVTLSNACSAGGYALAVAQDLLELGEADAVVVAAVDGLTESMLAMIGRFDGDPTDRVRPFDADRGGVLLGEGAAAVVLVPEGRPGPPPVARLLATGLSCDGRHETAPDVDGIRRAVLDALRRAGREPTDVDVVVAHGTGTRLNDPTEAAALRDVYGAVRPGPLVTGLKGAVGHTSGTSPLTSLAVAVHVLRTGAVPPVVGLRTPLPEGAGLRLVVGAPVTAEVGVVQVDSFGFGGVNAVSLLAAA